MPKKLPPDFANMTADQILNLNLNQQRMYEAWKEGQKRKKEIKVEFEDYLKNCYDQYIFYR